MIRILRHGAIRLWLLLLWGIPAGFWLLPRIMTWLPDLSAGTVMAMFLAAGGLLQGGLLELIGRQRLHNLIREGELWEQAGIRPRAEERYVKALRVFDSILVSPWISRMASRELSRVMAGFYLSGQVRYPGFRQAAARYLLHRPEDETLALLWLEHPSNRDGENGQDSLTRSVLTALAEVHHAHPKIALGLAIRFLDQERADFPARRLYRSVLRILDMDPDKNFPQAYREKMRTLLEPRGGLEGGLPDDAAKVETLGAGGEMYSPEIAGPGRAFSKVRERSWIREVSRFPGRVAGTAGEVLLSVMPHLTKAGSKLSGSAAFKRRGLRSIPKYTLMAVLAVCLGVFLWTSLAHMLKSTGPDPVMHPVNGVAPGAFTIQVAAYLKQPHADRYLKKLKALGIESAHIKKTRGGGKTWYLVRVSHFRTKQEAAAFGRKLKSDGKIEDFFVSNS